MFTFTCDLHHCRAALCVAIVNLTYHNHMIYGKLLINSKWQTTFTMYPVTVTAQLLNGL